MKNMFTLSILAFVATAVAAANPALAQEAAARVNTMQGLGAGLAAGLAVLGAGMASAASAAARSSRSPVSPRWPARSSST